MALILTTAFALAFLLIPAAQALALAKTIVTVKGSGAGEVSSVEGLGWSGYAKYGLGTSEFKGMFDGTPPIECTYKSPGPQAGVCENEVESIPGEGTGIALHAIAAAGSKFKEWIPNGGTFGCGKEEAEPVCFRETGSGNVEVTAEFVEEPGPEGFPLTLKKIGSGEGTGVSNPAGINCGLACTEETNSFGEELVTLTANPASNSLFKKWKGCVKSKKSPELEAKTGPKGHTCTVYMETGMTVEVEFVPAKDITASKTGSTGFGTISSSPAGIGCGSACTTATARFAEGTTVLLKAVPVSSSSTFNSGTGWTGCDSVNGEGKCVVAATAAKSVTAKFVAIPSNTLSFAKEGGGTGTVSSSPAGIGCGAACTSTQASYLETKTVLLKAVPSTGSTFNPATGWTGCDSVNGEGKCVVAMTSAKSVKAKFE